MIHFEHVCFEYPTPSGPLRALSDVDFTLEQGELVAVVGANGSGKSTLARLCDGLLVPTSGTVTVDGLDTRDPSATWDVRARVGLVMQNPDDQIVGGTVEDDTAFGPENLGLPRAEIGRRVESALAAVGLRGLERTEPHLLSEGQKQRLAVAGALAMEPAYIVFDEATSMLDARARDGVLSIVERLARGSGVGVVLVTHRLAEAALADRVVGLADGSVAFEGPPETLFADEASVSALRLGLPATVRLAIELRARGLEVPAAVATPEELVEALWR
jgi:energy-coupling factor transport system ATP-binding protein